MIFAAAFTFAQLLHSCAPNVGARTMTAIVRVESAGNPLAIHDNTLRRSFAPKDVRQAVVWANQLLTLRHSIDLGISQINSANLPRLALSIPAAFDACANLDAGSTILSANYRAAAGRFGSGQFALRRAIGAYNSGSLFAGYDYTERILRAAGMRAGDGLRVPDIQVAHNAQPDPLRLSAKTGVAKSRSSARFRYAAILVPVASSEQTSSTRKAQRPESSAILSGRSQAAPARAPAPPNAAQTSP